MHNDVKHAMQVLTCWHQIEFFQPYDLPDNDDTHKKPRLTADELNRVQDMLLPWLNPAAKNNLGMRQHKCYHFVLYLGLFDKRCIQNIVTAQLGDTGDDIKRIDWEERLELEGDTCFAKLQLGPLGTPDFAGMSVSTLPWALGHLQNGSLDQLSYKHFTDRCTLLQEELARLTLQLREHPDHPSHPTLTAAALQQLLKILFQWAQFEPPSDTHFQITLDWFEVENGKTKALDNQSNRLENKSTASTTDNPTNNAPETDSNGEDERKMPILNSFYIEDIERVLRSLGAGDRPAPLLHYLSQTRQRYEDLYTQPGLKRIIEHLQPTKTPSGRWPTSPNSNMSLMQQFAINTAVDALAQGGLLSVNGPPGTGKTTMLRDIIAHNIVKRAEVLATLDYTGQGLNNDGSPIDALRGYEMVVVSSNNAAVENVSRELPLRQNLATEFSDLDYFGPIANQLIAETNQTGQLKPIKQDADCWGIISAITGSKKRRQTFARRFINYDYHSGDRAKEKNRPPSENFLDYWGWYRTENVPSFKDSKTAFHNKYNELLQMQSEIQRYADLLKMHAGISKEQYLKAPQATVSQTQQTLEQQQQENNRLRQSLSLLSGQVELQELHLQQLLPEPMPWWLWLILWARRKAPSLHSPLIKQARSELIRLKKDVINQTRQLQQSETRITEAEQACAKARTALLSEQQLYEQSLQQLEHCQRRFSMMAIPDSTTDIGSAPLQRNAFWQDPAINRLRSELFVCALNLHKSWLKEATQFRTFRENMLFNLERCIVGDNNLAQPKALWATLFLIVPVLSTTFASFARQFKTLDTGDLGWLLIDEAGQAIPQAAVGGLWRARRVLIVGDPKQIKPVFTTPPKLVEWLTLKTLGLQADEWSPQQHSVQNLADRVNPYGCTLPDNERLSWIGIPLWVHRRCHDPMFGIANRIAYANRMIHGSDTADIQPRPHVALGYSRWISVPGYCSSKQYCPQHGEAVVQLLSVFLEHGCSLDDIYIITPFRAIKQSLKMLLENPALILAQNGRGQPLGYANWHKRNIGTIHTFQGKENSIVLLVLGCDLLNQGGANWASQEPNILNVAITRAKHHCFIIGDAQVWADKPFFSPLAEAFIRP